MDRHDGSVDPVGMEFQPSFAHSEYAGKKKVTRRDHFLTEMVAVVPWSLLVGLVEPFYPKRKRGRPPLGIERMLRVYFLQEWQGLADEALEDAIYDSQSMRHFTGIDLSVESVPDATTLLKVPHLLEKHDLTRKIFKQVNALLSEKQRLMRKGTIVDATIIAAAPSTKNKARKRAPEMHQTKKGNPYYFGRKAQVRALVVGHPFHVIQNLFGHRKARCRRLAKNQARLYSLFALANLTFAKRSLLRAIRARTPKTPGRALNPADRAPRRCRLPPSAHFLAARLLA